MTFSVIYFILRAIYVENKICLDFKLNIHKASYENISYKGIIKLDIRRNFKNKKHRVLNNFELLFLEYVNSFLGIRETNLHKNEKENATCLE